MENSNPISKIINDIIVLDIDPDLYMYINFVHMQKLLHKKLRVVLFLVSPMTLVLRVILVPP